MPTIWACIGNPVSLEHCELSLEPASGIVELFWRWTPIKRAPTPRAVPKLNGHPSLSRHHLPPIPSQSLPHPGKQAEALVYSPARVLFQVAPIHLAIHSFPPPPVPA